MLRTFSFSWNIKRTIKRCISLHNLKNMGRRFKRWSWIENWSVQPETVTICNLTSVRIRFCNPKYVTASPAFTVILLLEDEITGKRNEKFYFWSYKLRNLVKRIMPSLKIRNRSSMRIDQVFAVSLFISEEIIWYGMLLKQFLHGRGFGR